MESTRLIPITEFEALPKGDWATSRVNYISTSDKIGSKALKFAVQVGKKTFTVPLITDKDNREFILKVDFDNIKNEILKQCLTH
jgi:hypothetical protein